MDNVCIIQQTHSERKISIDIKEYYMSNKDTCFWHAIIKELKTKAIKLSKLWVVPLHCIHTKKKM